jgi:hypothetical protein
MKRVLGLLTILATTTIAIHAMQEMAHTEVPVQLKTFINQSGSQGDFSVTVQRGNRNAYGPLIFTERQGGLLNLPLLRGDVVIVRGPAGVELLKYSPSGRTPAIDIVLTGNVAKIVPSGTVR